MTKRIGLLTSGGDCAGLNAIIRAVVRHAVGTYGWQVVGIREGTIGLLARPPQMRLEVPPNAITANIVADLKGLQIRELGKHRLELRAGDRLLGSTPFTINLLLQDRRAANA